MEEMNVAVLAPNGRWDVDQTVLEKVLQGGCFCASNKFCDGKMNERTVVFFCCLYTTLNKTLQSISR